MLIPVIPVRETEAWLLVDRTAVREVAKVPRTRTDLGLPARPRDVETVRHPKAALDAALGRALGTKPTARRRRAVLESLARRVHLELLDEVPAFREFAADLERVMSGPTMTWL